MASGTPHQRAVEGAPCLVQLVQLRGKVRLHRTAECTDHTVTDRLRALVESTRAVLSERVKIRILIQRVEMAFSTLWIPTRR